MHIAIWEMELVEFYNQSGGPQSVECFFDVQKDAYCMVRCVKASGDVVHYCY